MILEIANLDVRPGQSEAFESAFQKAQTLIASMPGYLGHELQRCLEKEGHYVLLVRWATVAAHEQGFRRSPEYQEWRSLLHHFYDPFPSVHHYERAAGARSAARTLPKTSMEGPQAGERGILTRDQAERFAHEWIAAWNSHDLERILAHYRDDFTMSSPRIVTVAQEPSGILRGKAAIARYWADALAQAPELHFRLLNTFVGADSVALHYEGVRGPAIEVFFFDEDGLVRRAAAHYY